MNERLEEINEYLRRVVNRLIANGEITERGVQSIHWLIKQAERVQELEFLEDRLEEYSRRIYELEKQNKQYREKLEELEDMGLFVINYGGEIDANHLVDSIRQVEDDEE